MPDPHRSASKSFSAPRPIVPTPAAFGGQLRGRRVIVGVPGLGWRGDLRADEKVIQGSRTFVPILSESEWYRAESESTEVFAALIPVERVWVEEYGVAGIYIPTDDLVSTTHASLDEPPRRQPIFAGIADSLTGRRATLMTDEGDEQRALRAVTEPHTSEDGNVCVRVSAELDWYRWGWAGKTPRTMEVLIDRLWLE